MDFLLSLDQGLFRFINSLAGHLAPLDSLGTFLAQGSQVFMALLFVLALYLIYRRYPGQPLGFWLLAIVVVVVPVLLSNGLRELIMRPRPFMELDTTPLVEQAPRPALPSNHSAGSFAVAGMYRAFLPGQAPYIIVLAALVALSRVYIGTHFPLDVITGAIVGYLPGWLLSRFQPPSSRRLGSKQGSL